MGECFFWYRLIRVVPDKIHRAIKQLCVCVCVCARTHARTQILNMGIYNIAMLQQSQAVERFIVIINCSYYENNGKDQLSQTKYGTKESLERWKTEYISVDNFPSIVLLRNIIIIVNIVTCKIIPQNTSLENNAEPALSIL